MILARVSVDWRTGGDPLAPTESATTDALGLSRRRNRASVEGTGDNMQSSLSAHSKVWRTTAASSGWIVHRPPRRRGGWPGRPEFRRRGLAAITPSPWGGTVPAPGSTVHRFG